MPFQFLCQHCGRKLQASSRKIGREATCPGCQGRLVVPTKEVAREQIAARRASAPATTEKEEEEVNPYAEFSVYDDDTELVYETDDDAWDDGPPPTVDQTKLAVPRTVIYLQGILLGVVALVAFVLGILVGSGTTSNTPQNPRERPFRLSGAVTYEGATRGTLPDDGAVVLILPVGSLPERDGKIPIAGIGPDDPTPPVDSPALGILSDIGGAYARADAEGRFRATLPRLGKYYVLVLSRNKRPQPSATGSDPLNEQRRRQLGQLGNYVDDAAGLLSKYLYDWREEEYLDDKQLEVQFGKKPAATP